MLARDTAGMADWAPLPVDARLVEPFVILAEELHFTRAAERLHVAQPALSQQIARLERQLGTRLLRRSPQRVELTPAGRALLARLQPAYAELRAAIDDARETAAGHGGDLAVTFLSSLATRAVPLVAAAFAEERPEVALHLTEANLGTQLGQLRGEQVDVALFHVFDGVDADLDDLPLEVLARGPHLVALAPDHPRAGEEAIALEELADEEIIMPSGSAGAGYESGVRAMCRRHGFTPREAQQANSISAMLGLVAGGFGVTLTAWTAALAPRQDVVFVPIEGEVVDVVAVRAEHAPAAAGPFVDTARAVLRGLVRP
jgi:DNA-binding transcriptional LysR family regulator